MGKKRAVAAGLKWQARLIVLFAVWAPAACPTWGAALASKKSMASVTNTHSLPTALLQRKRQSSNAHG